MATIIDYERGQVQSQITAATFNLSNDKAIVLTVADMFDEEDVEKIVGQLLKMTIKDDSFGDEELFVELEINDGVDFVRILQRLLRQISSFKLESIEE